MSLAAVIIVGVGDGSNENIWIAVATAIAVGALIGLVNGLLIGGLKLNPLITTLAVGLIVAGVVNRYASTFPVQSRVPPGLSDWTSDRVFGVSPVFWTGCRAHGRPDRWPPLHSGGSPIPGGWGPTRWHRVSWVSG
jgi:Ribose/xylose/arabinose/galactoside ABC-type transport systems, permease components